MAFPETFLELIRSEVEKYMKPADYTIIDRPVRLNDPQKTISVYATNWVPDATSHEIGTNEPTLARYNLRLQLMVKHTNPSKGRAMSALDSKTLRMVLYRSPVLRVSLLGMTEEVLGSTERVKRFQVTGQNFMNGDLNGNHLYLSSTEAYIETELTV